MSPGNRMKNNERIGNIRSPPAHTHAKNYCCYFRTCHKSNPLPPPSVAITNAKRTHKNDIFAIQSINGCSVFAFRFPAKDFSPLNTHCSIHKIWVEFTCTKESLFTLSNPVPVPDPMQQSNAGNEGSDTPFNRFRIPSKFRLNEHRPTTVITGPEAAMTVRTKTEHRHLRNRLHPTVRVDRSPRGKRTFTQAAFYPPTAGVSTRPLRHRPGREWHFYLYRWFSSIARHRIKQVK